MRRGMHDMLENLREWVQDRYGDYSGGTATNQPGPRSGSSSVKSGRVS